MSYFDSKIKEDFGITGKEAVRKGYIQAWHEFNRQGQNVFRGWFCGRANSDIIHDSQYEAVKEYFDTLRNEELELEERWSRVDLQRTVHRGAYTYHTLVNRHTGKTVLNTINRDKIIEYFDAHEKLTHAKKVIPENQLAS